MPDPDPDADPIELPPVAVDPVDLLSPGQTFLPDMSGVEPEHDFTL